MSKTSDPGYIMPQGTAMPEKVWVSLSKDDGTPRGVWSVEGGPGSALPSQHILVPYVPESEVTRLRAEVEGAYREGYVDANGSDGNDPCAVDRDWENSLTRALLAARKEEG